MIHVDRYERIFIIIAIIVLAIFTTAVGVAGFSLGIQLPSPELRIDPRTAFDSGRFAEPGLYELAPGKYEAYFVAEAVPWVFTPREIDVPAGSTVTFYISSKDVQHGFQIRDTNVNIMVIPGQVSKLTHTFEEPGEYVFQCNEYCGLGHHTMFGVINVVP